MHSIAEATPNIAVIKYWGQRDSKLVLPLNSSISVTMDFSLRTRTRVEFGDFKKDRAFLNKKELSGEGLSRVMRIINTARNMKGERWKVLVKSENFFPTKAGFASSASGFAALAVAADAALNLKLKSPGLSMLARLSSGSASRSVLGGFVKWNAGECNDGLDSYAVQLAPASHWKELRNVAAVVDAHEKAVGSAEGMQRTVKTSPLFKKRLKELPERIANMERAIKKKDAHSFFSLTMEESDSMHASMADTKPPLHYMNDVSREIVAAINSLNKKEGESICGYTFDAGPNAHVYTLQKHVPAVKKALKSVSGVQKLFVCGVGSGPRVLEKG
ncbi:Diphosphomevalonate decarboxylase [Candidatus Anstonella stagnisolia]|nr:Diphosphomevalonate decarboxylase [Candidatus Anstonella stagnisolia]